MNFLKRFPLFETLLVAVILCIHLYAAFSDAFNFPNSWFTRDDAYYYFKVAQNITEGHGISFDGINLTNGYHPLWMVVCIPIFTLARFDVILPLRVMLMVMACLNAATAVLIYRLVKNNLSRAVALLAAPFWAFNFYIHNTVYKFGLETPLAAFVVILFIYKLSQFEKEWRTKPVTTRQLVMLAVSAVIVMFSRLDLIFLAVIGGIWIIFRGKPIRFLLPLDIVIIFISMTISVVLRTGMDNYNSLYAASTIKAVVLILIIKIISLYFFGAYQHPREHSIWTMMRKTVLALTASTVLAAGLYLLLAQLGFWQGFPRSAFIIDWGISSFLILALRLSARFIWFGDEKIKIGAQTILPLREFQMNWKNWLTEGITYFGILGGALSLYMIFNKIVFGTSSPVSGQIKHWWGTLGETVYEKPAPNWTSFFGISFKGAFDAWQPASDALLYFAKIIHPLYRGANTEDERYFIVIFVFVILALILLAVNTRRSLHKVTKMALIPLAASCGIQILSYTTTAYGGTKEWYWLSQMILVTLAGSVLLDLILRPLQKYNAARMVLEFTSAMLGIFLAYNFGLQVIYTMPYNYFPAGRPYMEVLPYLEENTPPGSVIGMTGGGNVGYFINDRTIVNMDGLINSNDYFHALQNGQAPVYLSQHGVDIIFASSGLLTFPPYDRQFDPYLEQFSVYGGKGLFYLLKEPKY